MGVWRREGESLWWRFFFYSSLASVAPLVCVNIQIKKNLFISQYLFLCGFLFWMHVVLYVATSWHYKCVYMYTRRLNVVVQIHKMHMGTVAWLESAQRRPNVSGLPLPDHLVGDLREHVKGELVHVTCGCATISRFGSKSFTKQQVVVTYEVLKCGRATSSIVILSIFNFLPLRWSKSRTFDKYQHLNVSIAAIADLAVAATSLANFFMDRCGLM